MHARRWFDRKVTQGQPDDGAWKGLPSVVVLVVVMGRQSKQAERQETDKVNSEEIQGQSAAVASKQKRAARRPTKGLRNR